MDGVPRLRYTQVDNPHGEGKISAALGTNGFSEFTPIQQKYPWKSWIEYAMVWSLLILAIIAVGAVGIILLNTPNIYHSAAQMDGMYTMMLNMNNMTEIITHAIDLQDPQTQKKLNTAFLEILDTISISHNVVKNATIVVKESVSQINEVNQFLGQFEYQELYMTLLNLTNKVQNILAHFDEDGIIIGIS